MDNFYNDLKVIIAEAQMAGMQIATVVFGIYFGRTQAANDIVAGTLPSEFISAGISQETFKELSMKLSTLIEEVPFAYSTAYQIAQGNYTHHMLSVADPFVAVQGNESCLFTQCLSGMDGIDSDLVAVVEANSVAAVKLLTLLREHKV